MILQKLIFTERKYRFRNKRDYKEIHLHLNIFIIFYKRLVFYADSSLSINFLSNVSFQIKNYHENIKQSLSHVQNNILALIKIKIVDYLYSSFLLLFTDIFCLFSENIDNLEHVTEYLISWFEKNQTSAVSKKLNSDLVLVIESKTLRIQIEQDIKRKIFYMLRQHIIKSIFEHFSDINIIIILSENKVFSQAHHKCLKKYLMNTSDQIQKYRLDISILFSVMYLIIFFKHVCDYLILTFNELFNFIKISRLHNLVSLKIKSHLIRFLKYFRSFLELLKIIIFIIMFILLLNVYSSDMHDKFFIFSRNRSLTVWSL